MIILKLEKQCWNATKATVRWHHIALLFLNRWEMWSQNLQGTCCFHSSMKCVSRGGQQHMQHVLIASCLYRRLEASPRYHR